MFDFKPDEFKKEPEKVPFYEEATVANGWQGQTTNKSIETLKSEIRSSLTELGAEATEFNKGTFGDRIGYRINYVLEVPGKGGRVANLNGYIDVAALPIKPVNHWDARHRTPDSIRQDRALRMALFNVSACLKALWVLQRLSPGFAPLMPFMIGQNGQNLTQMWSNGSAMKALMPPADNFEDAIEGEAREVGR
jgi:hypothetical protein